MKRDAHARRGDRKAGDIDLTSFARALERDGRHSNLTNKIRQATSVASAHQDLEAARETLDELKRLTDLRDTDTIYPRKAGILGGALFAHSIVLYARATETKPIDRWKWFSRTMLGDELRPWHGHVMTYRDTVLAHFGRGDEQSDGPSVTHALVMRRPKPEIAGIEVMFVENRANTRSNLTTKVAALVEACLELAKGCFHARLQELQGELSTAAKNDPGIAIQARMHTFDPATFLEHLEFDLDMIGSDPHHWIKRVAPR